MSRQVLTPEELATWRTAAERDADLAAAYPRGINARRVLVLLDALIEAEARGAERVETVISDYAPTIKAQLECHDRSDCGCTFCDFVADLRAAIAAN